MTHNSIQNLGFVNHLLQIGFGRLDIKVPCNYGGLYNKIAIANELVICQALATNLQCSRKVDRPKMTQTTYVISETKAHCKRCRKLCECLIWSMQA